MLREGAVDKTLYEHWREVWHDRFRPYTGRRMYRVNGSSIKMFTKCRFRWWCEWVMNRSPRKTAAALTGGRLLHTIFEDHFQNDTPLGFAATVQTSKFRQEMLHMPAGDLFEAEKAVKIIEDLTEALPFWEDKFKFDKMLECEKPFSIVLPEYHDGIEWIGRPDYIGTCAGRIWHRQNRGLAAAQNFGTYLALAKRHYHEHLYAEYAAREYAHLKMPYGGTQFNLVRKLKYRTNAGKKNEAVKHPDEMFNTMVMSINLKSGQHKAVMQTMVQHVEEMMRVEREWREEGKIPAPNDEMNGGYGGNALDPYFRVLIGEIKLSDDTWFKDREDTYAEPIADEA